MSQKPVGKIVRSFFAIVMASAIAFVASPLMTAPQRVARAESRATNWLQNGSFESALTNWTAVETRVDLGVTSLGGCVTTDTVDYAGIWTRDPLYGTVPVYTGGSNPKMPVDDNDTGSFSGFTVTTPATASSAPTM